MTINLTPKTGESAVQGGFWKCSCLSGLVDRAALLTAAKVDLIAVQSIGLRHYTADTLNTLQSWLRSAVSSHSKSCTNDSSEGGSMSRLSENSHIF
jgi:hypothetical protein